LTEDTYQEVTRDVRAALRDYLDDGELAMPMEAHVALARA
jgi:hypothetical protein